MSILYKLSDINEWINYYEYKVSSAHINNKDARDLYEFIRGKQYQPIVDKMINGEDFTFPQKRQIKKTDTNKMRVIYCFSREESYTLKLLTYLLIRKYDKIFSTNLYSFRNNHSVKGAIKKIVSTPHINTCYTYKIDVSNYFNSINIDKLLGKLKELFSTDTKLYSFISKLLSIPYCVANGKIVSEDKGVMAGVPIACFLANIYLSELDNHFDNEKILYCRYSDDIIIFAQSQEEIERGRDIILSYINKLDLSVNSEKEVYTKPGDKWSFLGFSYQSGKIDISDISKTKLKAKMRRKARALYRWRVSKNIAPERAIKAFIRVFNNKFFYTTDTHETNWSRWYFPIISTDKTLKEIDTYMQSCIRYIYTGKHKKSNYNFRYSQMKELGYETLVNNWYTQRGKDSQEEKVCN